MAVALNANVSSTPAEATRDGFGKGLVELAEKNPRVVALSGDLNDSTRVDWLREKFPEKFVQAGIAEQNMVGMAAGLSLSGRVPFAATFGPFMLRAADHIRVSIAFSNLNVKLAATHCGLTTGEDGGNAQVLEDLAFFRALPNFTVIAPCDSLEAKKATIAAGEAAGPHYLRLGREKTPTITSEETPFKIGRAEIFRDGGDVAIIACGIMVGEALKAAESLARERKIEAEVINLHTIKPIDEKAIVAAARKCGCVVTAEEHQVHAGMGSAVAEVLGEKMPVPLRMVGVRDKFGTSGKGMELLKAYGLTAEKIAQAAEEVVKLKK
ncbi:transketolase family protein [Candidatus Micrarchaeota archaeon]|nr:transketolase family protein [Candidatus Micrarchaeota archaeon]